MPLTLESGPTTIAPMPNDMPRPCDPPFATRLGVVSYRDVPVNASNMEQHGKEKTDGSDPIIVSIYLLAPLEPSNETLISC